MTLEPFADGIWTATRELRFWGVETGARMTLVRRASGGLIVHSPGPLDDALRREIDALGSVVAVLAPSKFHHLHAGEWKAAYPEAVLACCPSLVAKRPDLSFDHVLGDTPEPEWVDDLQQVYFSARTLEDEVVFFHPATRTMILCDAIFHLHAHPSRFTRAVAWLIGNTRPGATRLEHIMMRDRAAAREQVDRMLAWDIEGIVLSHGPLIPSGGREVLRQAYAWL